MKHIDADLLRKEVKRLEKAAHKSASGCADSETRKFHEGKDFAYQHVGILIDSLQQEQQEVDLEKDFSIAWAKLPIPKEFIPDLLVKRGLREFIYKTARQFYELGRLNAKKEK